MVNYAHLNRNRKTTMSHYQNRRPNIRYTALPEEIAEVTHTKTSSGTFGYKVKLKPLPKHDNEITGALHNDKKRDPVLLAAVFIILACGVIYLVAFV